MGQSPFGKYAAPVAAVAALGVIGAWLLVAITSGPDSTVLDRLTPYATLALGAVFGSAVAVNGYKAPIAAAHNRLDRLQAAVESTATQALPPAAAAGVAQLLTQPGSPPPVSPGPPA
jgi:hypothetical protein